MTAYRFERLAVALVAANAVFLALTLLACRATGLTIRWETFAPAFAVSGLLLALRLYHWWAPDPRNDGRVPDLLLIAVLLLMLTDIAAPAQYAALALERPLIDSSLAAWDAALGFDAAAVAAWMWRHALVRSVLQLVYATLLGQLAVTPIVLLLVRRRRDRAWEFIFHVSVCAYAAVLCLALAPAAHVFVYRHFTPSYDFSRLPSQIAGLRDGTLRVIGFADLDGLISLPSFHTVVALAVAWALRGEGAWGAAALALNGLMLAATALSGAHYFVDLPLSAGLFVISVAFYRRLVAPRLVDGAATAARATAAQKAA